MFNAATKPRPDGLNACLAIVNSTGHSPEKTLWNDEMTRQERRIFLIAARLNMRWDNKTWGELSELARAEVKRAMFRFKKRFGPLLDRLEGGEA